MEHIVVVALVCAVPILWIVYSAFQRWLQHKEQMEQLIAQQTAERTSNYAVRDERVEARLRVVEQIVTDGGIQTAAQIDALRDLPTKDSLAISKDL